MIDFNATANMYCRKGIISSLGSCFHLFTNSFPIYKKMKNLMKKTKLFSFYFNKCSGGFINHIYSKFFVIELAQFKIILFSISLIL